MSSKSVTYRNSQFCCTVSTAPSKGASGTTSLLGILLSHPEPMNALQPSTSWGSIRDLLAALRETWHRTDNYIAPNCGERAMHFPPSRFCHAHSDSVTLKRSR
jgi:hypothetical protein